MFDFLSYVRDSGLEIRLMPPSAGELIALEVLDQASGHRERHRITNRDAAACTNIDQYTGRVLDQMAAKIGSRKAKEYANRHGSRKRQEIEDFFREA